MRKWQRVRSRVKRRHPHRPRAAGTLTNSWQPAVLGSSNVGYDRNPRCDVNGDLLLGAAPEWLRLKCSTEKRAEHS